MGIYAHSMQRLLIAQIDAAINAGNNGGPVLAGNQLVGIAPQTLDGNRSRDKPCIVA